PMLGTYLTAVKSNNIGSLGSCAAADRTSRCTSWHAASSNALQCTTAQTTSACGSIETAGFSGMVFLVVLTTVLSDQLSNLQNAPHRPPKFRAWPSIIAPGWSLDAGLRCRKSDPPDTTLPGVDRMSAFPIRRWRCNR